jgi:hypothetical protein
MGIWDIQAKNSPSKKRRLATLGAFQLPRAQAQNRHPRASQVNLGTGEPGEKHRKIMGKTWENPW